MSSHRHLDLRVIFRQHQVRLAPSRPRLGPTRCLLRPVPAPCRRPLAKDSGFRQLPVMAQLMVFLPRLDRAAGFRLRPEAGPVVTYRQPLAQHLAQATASRQHPARVPAMDSHLLLRLRPGRVLAATFPRLLAAALVPRLHQVRVQVSALAPAAVFLLRQEPRSMDFRRVRVRATACRPHRPVSPAMTRASQRCSTTWTMAFRHRRRLAILLEAACQQLPAPTPGRSAWFRQHREPQDPVRVPHRQAQAPLRVPALRWVASPEFGPSSSAISATPRSAPANE
jgi:hypothetical protein